MAMVPFVWKEGMSSEVEADGAYWERNMLALHMGVYANQSYQAYVDLLKAEGRDEKLDIKDYPPCGWYYHTIGEGWSRVISLFDGRMCFHIPDDFDLGNKLPQIEPNWNGHGTEDKWLRVMKKCGCELPDLEK